MPEPINCPGCGNIVLSGDRSAKCLGCEVYVFPCFFSYSVPPPCARLGSLTLVCFGRYSKAFHAAKKEDTTTTTKGNVQPAPVRGKE